MQRTTYNWWLRCTGVSFGDLPSYIIHSSANPLYRLRDLLLLSNQWPLNGFRLLSIPTSFFVFQSTEINKTIMTCSCCSHRDGCSSPQNFDPDPFDCSIQILIMQNLCPRNLRSVCFKTRSTAYPLHWPLYSNPEQQQNKRDSTLAWRRV